MFATNSGQLKIHSKPTTENRFMVSVFGSFLRSLRSLRNDNKIFSECQEITQPIPYNDFPRINPEWESMGSRYNGFSISPYILCGLVGVVILGFLIIVLVK